MQSEDKTVEKINKLQINMSEKALRELEDLRAQIDAPTKTQVIKSSLKVLKYLEDAKAKGGKIIIKDKDGKEKELVLF